MSPPQKPNFRALINSDQFVEIKCKSTEKPLFAHRQVEPFIRLMAEHSIVDPNLSCVPQIAAELGIDADAIIHDDSALDHYELLGTHEEEYASYGSVRVIADRPPKAVRERATTIHRRPQVKTYRISGGNLFVGFHLDTPMLARVRSGTVFGMAQALPKAYQLLNFAGGMPPEVFARVEHEVESAVFIGDSFAFTNYAHWTLDWLPRLRWLRDYCDFSSTAIVFNQRPTRFNIAMLEKLGFKRENIIAPEDRSPTFMVRAKNVYTTNLAREFRHSCYAGASWAIDFLRDAFQQKERSAFEPGLRLVIMRGQRGLTFSDVVRRDLEKRGFVFVRPELLDHNSQVELFANASVIIATHGAGLSNLAFCQPGTKVLELFNNTLSTHAFYTVAHFGGLDYSCCVTDPLEPAKSGKPIDDDCHLDESTYSQWISAVGL